MEKIFIEVQSIGKFSKKYLEKIAELIIENANAGIALVSIKDNINELPELKDGNHAKVEGVKE